MSTTSEAAIYNLALSHVGNSVEVQNSTENTANANACRRFYAQARDELLDNFAWPFATAFATLALVTNAPTVEWAYAYQLPSDCFTPRRILNTVKAGRNPTNADRIPYRQVGQLLYTDQASAVLEYTVAETDPTLFSPTFTAALALLLASYIAPRVTGGDPYQLGTRSIKLYQMAIQVATANAVNSEQPDPTPDSEFIEARL